MFSFAHKFLALSNLCGLLPLYYADGWMEIFVVAGTMAASMAMHLTETKHRLNPGTMFLPYSGMSLNIDRTMAVMATLYLLPKWWNMQFLPKMDILALFCGGLLFSAVGELTNSLKVYVVCHTLWHVVVYSTMFILFT